MSQLPVEDEDDDDDDAAAISYQLMDGNPYDNDQMQHAARTTAYASLSIDRRWITTNPYDNTYDNHPDRRIPFGTDTTSSDDYPNTWRNSQYDANSSHHNQWNNNNLPLSINDAMYPSILEPLRVFPFDSNEHSQGSIHRDGFPSAEYDDFTSSCRAPQQGDGQQSDAVSFHQCSSSPRAQHVEYINSQRSFRRQLQQRSQLGQQQLHDDSANSDLQPTPLDFETATTMQRVHLPQQSDISFFFPSMRNAADHQSTYTPPSSLTVPFATSHANNIGNMATTTYQRQPSLASNAPPSHIPLPYPNVLQRHARQLSSFPSSDPSNRLPPPFAATPIRLQPPTQYPPLIEPMAATTQMPSNFSLSCSNEPLMNPVALMPTRYDTTSMYSPGVYHHSQPSMTSTSVPQQVAAASMRNDNSNMAELIRTITGANDTNDDRSNSQSSSTSSYSTAVVVRPLSPYNYFFRYERERIIRRSQLGDDESSTGRQPMYDDIDLHKLNVHNSEEFQLRLLQEQWSRPPKNSKKRIHRKTHGCISFQALTERIATSWRNMPESTRDVFREIARKDRERYTSEVRTQYNNNQRRQS